MKTILALLIGIFFTLQLNAECASSGLWVFPSNKTINKNSIFLIEGYARSQSIILELNKKYSIYLKNENNKIKLLVAEILKGQFALTQALLKPESELEPGLEYTMVIDSLPKTESFNRYNYTSETYEPITYNVIAEEDTEKPQLTSQPKEIRKTWHFFGCGPAVHVDFTLPVFDSSEIIIKTILKNITTGKETTYFIFPIKNEIQVGHNMCSGAFTFEEGENYEVVFSFMDASGNITVQTDKINFTKPKE